MRTLKRILTIIIFIFLFFSLSKNIFDYKKTLSFYQSFKSDYEKEKKKKVTLQTQLLKNRDLDEIEKNIREKLNLLRPGEIAVIIPTPTPTPQPKVTPALPFYLRLFQFFFKK